MNLQVNEIFTSLSGEPDAFGNQGGLTTFIRLQGCNLKCTWCDTGYACFSKGGELININTIAAEYKTSHVILTGGEPLLQREEVKVLVTKLIDKGQWVTIETNGTQKPLHIIQNRGHWRLPPVRHVVDYKLNSSGMTSQMEDHVFDTLTCFDLIKFVIADKKDYIQAKEVLTNNPHWQSRIVFSPMIAAGGGICFATMLAKQIIADRLEFVQFAIQLHKLVNIQ